MEEAQAGAPAPEPKKKKGGVLKLLLIAGVVLLAAAGGGTWWMLRGTPASAEVKEPGPETRGLVPFEPYLVNLVDAGGARFLKVTLQLVTATKADATEIEETPVLLMQLRSTVLELLSQQTATALVTVEGKQALKDAIRERVNARLGHEKVIDVLFSEFVVQF